MGGVLATNAIRTAAAVDGKAVPGPTLGVPVYRDWERSVQVGRFQAVRWTTVTMAAVELGIHAYLAPDHLEEKPYVGGEALRRGAARGEREAPS